MTHPSRRRRELPERLSLLAGDVAAVTAGLRSAHWLHERFTPGFVAGQPFEWLGPLVIVQIVIIPAVFFFMRLYHLPRGFSRLDLVDRLVRATSLGVILTYALTVFLFPGLAFSRALPIYDWLATTAFGVALRLLIRAAWGALRAAGFGRDRVIIVGAGPAGQDVAARILRRPWLGYEIVGLVDDTPGRTRARGVPVVGRTWELGGVVESLGADEVLIALPEATHEELVGLVSQCMREGLSIKVFPDVFQIMASEVQIGDLDGLPLLTMRDVALRGWQRTLKRAVDFVVSGAVLVALSPLMLLVAIAVKMDSKGTAFYVQERVGLDGRAFQMLKFRSMRLGAEEETGAVWASRGDPRVTRLGRFLRRSSVDELPQFINVLLGDMSIVGPRPERPEFVAEFRQNIPRYMERHLEKAGLTGWAQINGLRGRTSIEERTKYDLYYIENWSLLFDFKIMAQTALSVLRDVNAY